MKHNTFWRKLLILMLVASFGGSSLQTASAQTATDLVRRELAFTNDDVQLAGTLFLPAGEGPFPAVVVMHGAGPEARAPYIPDAQMLAEGGIAAFVFDKRGTGASTGDWQRSSLDDLMADGLAAITLLQGQPEIEPGQIGILGSSQGAWLAPFMAARSEQVAFFVQVTGSATPLANQEMWGTGNSLRSLGFSGQALKTTMKAMHLLYSSRGLIRRGILPLGDLWFVHYDPTLDPADAWPNVDVPALVLFGGQDATVPTESSLNIVREAWSENGHAQSRIVVFPDEGHALGGASRNQDAAYASLVAGWIQAVTNGTAVPEMPFSDIVSSSDGLRWYGLGAAPTPWYATAGVQLPLILGFLLIFVFAVILSLLPWVKLGGGLPRFLFGLTGLVNAFSVAGLGYVLNYLLNADAESASPAVPLSGWLFPLAWASVLLAVGLTYAWRRSRDKNRAGFGRLALTFVMLASWGFIPFLGYWGLLAGPL